MQPLDDRSVGPQVERLEIQAFSSTTGIQATSIQSMASNTPLEIVANGTKCISLQASRTASGGYNNYFTFFDTDNSTSKYAWSLDGSKNYNVTASGVLDYSWWIRQSDAAFGIGGRKLLLGSPSASPIQAVTFTSSSANITFPDPGVAANVVYDVSVQTISGQKTFSNANQSSNTTGVIIQPVSNGGNNGNSYFPLYLVEQAGGTAKRTGIQLGTNWQIGIDPTNNGTRDIFIFGQNSNNLPLQIAYSDGTITHGSGVVKSTYSITGALTLSQFHSGRILQVSTAASDYIITLPNVQASIAGYEYTFVFTNVTVVGNVTIYCASLNKLYGFGDGTAQYLKQQVKFNQFSLNLGDRCFARCDGTQWTLEVWTGNTLGQTWS